MDNKLEKLFCELLETWFSLKLIAGDATVPEASRLKSGFAADVIDECLRCSGFGLDTSDYLLEKLQLTFES